MLRNGGLGGKGLEVGIDDHIKVLLGGVLKWNTNGALRSEDFIS